MKLYKICILSDKFYQKFPKEKFPEILHKGETRPYLILLVEIGGKTFGIPFRSNINHKYCFKILNNRNQNEGLDYTKAVVITEEDIGGSAHLRPDTLPQVDGFIDVIVRDFAKFLEKFKEILNKEKLNRTEQIIFNNCTLKYFDIQNKENN